MFIRCHQHRVNMKHQKGRPKHIAPTEMDRAIFCIAVARIVSGVMKLVGRLLSTKDLHVKFMRIPCHRFAATGDFVQASMSYGKP